MIIFTDGSAKRGVQSGRSFIANIVITNDNDTINKLGVAASPTTSSICMKIKTIAETLERNNISPPYTRTICLTD